METLITFLTSEEGRQMISAIVGGLVGLFIKRPKVGDKVADKIKGVINK